MKVLLDANLLVLLVVGLTDRVAIAKHKRSRAFDGDDLDLLLRLIRPFRNCVVTPNIVTEASNLLMQSGSNLAAKPFMRTLARLLRDGPPFLESYVPSLQACGRSELDRLGVGDCATICTIVESGTVDHVITADLDLYLALARGDYSERITNFHHARTFRLD